MKYPVPIILSALCSALLASCVSIKPHYGLAQIKPDSLSLSRIDVEEYKKKYEGKDGVFIENHNVVDHVLLGQNWEAYQFSTLRFIILNKDAEWLNTFAVRVRPGEELRNAYVNVISPGGTFRSYTIADMKVEKDSDGETVYRFAYPDVQVGTVVDEGYEIRYPNGSDLAQKEFRLQFSVPCEKLNVKFAYPKEFGIRIKTLAPGKRLNYKYDYSKKSLEVLEYEATDIPPIANEPYSPYMKERMDYMELAITSWNGSGGIKNWSEYAEGYKSFAIDKESFWRDRAGDVLDDIVADGMTDYQKLDTIISWLQENIEVGWTPPDYNFNDVIKKKKGNVYLVNGLGRLMLEKAGIPAAFVLIHSAEDGYFDQDYIVPGILNLPAIMVTIDEKDYVVFPYIKNLPVDHVPEYIQGQTALQINSDGYNGFAKIPYGNLSQNTVVENYNLSIDEDGEITVTEEKEFRGSTAFEIRNALKKAKEEEMEKIMKNLLTYEEGDVKLKSYNIENREAYKKPLTIRMEYTIDNLVTVTPEEVIFQTGGLFSPASNQSTKVDTKERKNPIRIYYDERFVKNITIHYPDAWTLSTGLKDVSYENQFGLIKATYSNSAGQFKIEQERMLNHSDEPATKFDDLLKIIGKRSQLYIPTLIFAVQDGMGDATTGEGAESGIAAEQE